MEYTVSHSLLLVYRVFCYWYIGPKSKISVSAIYGADIIGIVIYQIF